MTLQKKHRRAKKRGSVIAFVSAYKKVGLKEAGKRLKEILKASARPQVKEAPASKPARKRKGKERVLSQS